MAGKEAFYAAVSDDPAGLGTCALGREANVYDAFAGGILGADFYDHSLTSWETAWIDLGGEG